MSHIVVSRKCHIDAYNKTVCGQAWHTHTTVHAGNTQDKKKKQTEHSAIGKALELTRSQKRHIAEYSWSQLSDRPAGDPS